MPFTFTKLELDGLVLIEPKVFSDERGYFFESYKHSDFARSGIDAAFVQDNHSLSKKGVIRGLHYQQNPMAQGKLVRVIRGALWDVAVDIRRSSKNFKKWIAVELSEDNKRMLYVPPGFAHGFLALTDDAHLVYKCTEEYSPQHDSGIRWDDLEISVQWPVQKPLVSEKDERLPYLRDAIIF